MPHLMVFSSFSQTGWVKWTSQPVDLQDNNTGTVVIDGTTYIVKVTATTNQSPPDGGTYDNSDSNNILDGGQGYLLTTNTVPTLTEGTYSPGSFTDDENYVLFTTHDAYAKPSILTFEFFESDGTTPADLVIVSANSADTDHQRINQNELGYPSDCSSGEIIFYDDGYTMSGDTFSNTGTSNPQTNPAPTIDPNGVHYEDSTKLTQESDDDNYFFFTGSGAGVDGFVYTFDGSSDTNTSCAGGEHSASNQRNIFALELGEPSGQSISGTVFNDANGLTDNIVNGTGIGSPDSAPLYANLLDSSGNVVATVAVNTNGTYSFSSVDNGTYTVQISTNQGTVGSAAPTTALPSGWINTGENIGTGTGNDGTADGTQSVTVNGADITEINFGIRDESLLPVKLSSFEATESGLDVVLTWITLSEINNEKFIVEYSVDGQSYIQLAEVAGQGTTTETTYYDYVHQEASSEAGELYYRLLQVDFDGTTSYESNVKSVLFENRAFIVYPTLIQRGDDIKVRGSQVGLEYSIYNMVGTLVSVGKVNQPSFEIGTNELSSGVYILNFTNGQTVKFIVR